MALSTNTVANATDISPSFARTTGPMAAIALPPQIAVPELGSVDFSGDKFVSLMKNPLFYHMENDYLNILASIVLPVQMLEYFFHSRNRAEFHGNTHPLR